MRISPRGVQRFHDLMPFRIREVLLVASPFDAFILEEDGLLTEQVFLEYRDLSLPASPRFTHVATGEEAIRKLKEQRYDLILAMARLADTDVNDFGRRVKRLRPGRPVVVLALDSEEIHRPGFAIDPQAIDGAFVWAGDAEILLAIIKYVEDRDNIDHDIAKGNVRAIIMIEDSPRYYSLFLGMLYRELMKHARSLYTEGTNELQRRMYMSSRPKILHAASYEEGVRLFERYRRNVLAIISDVGILRQGLHNSEAGLDLLELVHEADPELPLLLQSAEPDVEGKAKRLGATFVDKSSPHLLEEIGNFLSTNLGFGDFVFRDRQGDEVERASDMRGMIRKLAKVPAESLEYHASHNHFSIWLMARGEFEMAEQLRPMTIHDFGDVERFRERMIALLNAAQRDTHRGTISDFSRQRFEHHLMMRLGEGALGGKARGIAFMYRRLSDFGDETFHDLPVRFPKTIVLASDLFDAFVAQGDLRHFAVAEGDDREIERRFLREQLPEQLAGDLLVVVESLEGPLAVRSSSLLEDSLHQPFAGVYATLMIPNGSPDPRQRLAELCAAVKLVYASTFSQNAKSYLKATGKRVEEEKMAVIVQSLVGRRYGRRFYPAFAGVAESYNFYPLGPQKPEDGVVHVALGLGRFVVAGGAALRFNPHLPGVLPPFPNARAMLNNTQRKFYALDMEHASTDLARDLAAAVREFELQDAEDDGTLAPVGSVFSADDGRVRDDLSLKGPRVVTFNNILRHRAIPLADTLCRLLQIAEDGLGGPVEIEFACDMGDWGRRVRRGEKLYLPTFYLLQIRPFAAFTRHAESVQLNFARGESLCVSSRSLGHGVKKLADVVYVRRDRWQAERNKAIAAELAEVNAGLGREGRPYMLIGPGRWGTADDWLGIPVQWAQISNVKVLVEASPADYDVEPSQGTHFFQNLTSRRLGYITLPPGADKNGGGDFLDWDWLDAQGAHRETEHLRHLRLEEPLVVVLNGRDGRAVVAKPGAKGEGSGVITRPSAEALAEA
ncbi:MAG TPA: PEP/pyruvate-binding domain-containing protein [Thermoanaerobaculia bacterium]